MANGIIYLIKNSISQKCYVGLTIKTVEKRWKEHIASAAQGDERPFYCAIRKYGKESFVISILEICNINDLCDAEIKWIKPLDTMNC